MPTRQQRIDAIVARERKKGKSRAQALDIAMTSVAKNQAGTSSTPIYDDAVSKAKKRGQKIPTLANQ